MRTAYSRPLRGVLLAAFACLAFARLSTGQSPKPTVFTSDIDHFWEAYDSVRSSRDTLQQLRFIQELYIDRGTPGLHAFMQSRGYTASHWLKIIRAYPRFWASIRPNTLAVKSKVPEIESSIQRLRTLYPGLKEAKMYFTIGGLNTGGTTLEDKVLIGTEIATGNAATDVSELPGHWLAGVFKEQSAENLVSLNVHEYVHTQQHHGQDYTPNLLAQAIGEGACDFIAELATGKTLQRNYLTYGRAHEAALKERFRQDMFGRNFGQWLYNGSHAEGVADLGYFMGYAICKAYYRQATDKRQAVKDIIELDLMDTTKVEAFLKRSGYYAGPLR